MNTISASKCADWLRAHLSPESMECVAVGGVRLKSPTLKYQYPADSGKKVALARLLYRSFVDSATVLVWVREWNVWPSSGHLPLLLALRKALGESKDLEETPGHLFAVQEKEDAISALILGLEFYWDCLVCGSESGIVVELSHDEFYCIYGDSAPNLAGIETLLAPGKWGRKFP